MTRHKWEDGPRSPKTLRKRAEDLVRTSRTDIANMDHEEVQRLVHELQVHQIELQLQNEELCEAQVELAESRDRYAELYEFAPVGYVTLDRYGRIVQANLSFAIMLGVERHVLLQTQFSNFITRESQDDFHLHRQTMLTNETKQKCELGMKKADGTVLFMRLESVASGADEDRLCQIALIDQTAEKCLQERNRNIAERYRRLTDAVTDYVYEVQIEQGQVVETVHSDRCQAVTGYTAEEFAANPMLWISMVPSEDRAIVEKQIDCVLHRQDAFAIEHRICRKDGQVCWVRSTVSPHYDEQGHLIAYDGLLHDITDRKRAEEALLKLAQELEQRVAAQTSEIHLLAAALSQLGEGVVITGDECDGGEPKIMFVNDAMCRISGYTADELVGQTMHLLQGEKTADGTLQPMKTESAADGSIKCEMTNYRNDGVAYDVEVCTSPVFDVNRHQANFVSVYRDISSRKKAELALRHSEERMRAILRTAADAIITVVDAARSSMPT